VENETENMSLYGRCILMVWVCGYSGNVGINRKLHVVGEEVLRSTAV
jgi:hypothetical protein